MEIQKELQAFRTVAISKGWDMDGETTSSNFNFYSLQTRSAWESWQAAKDQTVPEGFVLVPVDQLNQWGHMANYAEQYSCPECFEARGYAHTLTCEINEYFAIEAQEQSHD